MDLVDVPADLGPMTVAQVSPSGFTSVAGRLEGYQIAERGMLW